MKLSCLPVSLFKELDSGEMSIKEWAEYGKGLNLDAQRKREKVYLENDIAVASQLGAKFLRVTAGQAHPETSREDGIKWAIAGLLSVEETAKEFGVELVYEDHSKPGGWDYMDFSNPPDIFLEIAKGIKGSSIGINFDTANILVAGVEKTVEVLEEVIDQVKTIHVNDITTIGKMETCVIGTGIVPNQEVFKCLKKHGWDNWLCIEEWGNKGLAGVDQAVATTRKMWAEA